MNCVGDEEEQQYTLPIFSCRRRTTHSCKQPRDENSAASITMLAMSSSDDDDHEREYTVADLKARPKSYKALASLTGVALVELKKMTKAQMRTLPVRHYNFDTSIFKARSSKVAAAAAPPTSTGGGAATGWGIQDDISEESTDDDGTGGGATGSQPAGDPFGVLAARASAMEKQWNASPPSEKAAPADSDALSSAFSSAAMASTPDVPVVVKPKQQQQRRHVDATAASRQTGQSGDSVEALTRAATTPPAASSSAHAPSTNTAAGGEGEGEGGCLLYTSPSPRDRG